MRLYPEPHIEAKGIFMPNCSEYQAFITVEALM